MLKNLLLTFGLIFATSFMAFAQEGALQGTVLDKETNEPIPFANVVLEIKGTQVGGATSDFDGKYQIKPLTPGKYNLKATFVGYKTLLIEGIIIGGLGQIRFYDVKLTSTSEVLDEVEVISYKVPLIDKDQTASGATVTAEEISKMPNRNANAVATTVGGVFSEDGERGSVRGARTGATATFIDGVRVIGNSSIPQSAIEQVDVILGGVPARYGDLTSGIINVTTKGPAREFGAGIELETSEFLDGYGHNRVGFNLMGPLIKGKNKNTSLLGFFIAGDINVNATSNPTSTGFYSLTDENLQILQDNPVRPTGTGSGTFTNGQFLRNSDLNHIKVAQNTGNESYNFIGNINIRTTETINLTVGGSYYYSNGNAYSYSATLANWDKNALYKSETYRGYVRFTQRFPSDPESTSAFKNFYYSLQFDYSKVKSERGDPNHWDDLWKYGYLGKFSTYKTPTYELGSDTVNGQLYEDVWLLNSWDFDTLVEWSPRDINPLVANYTSDYYDIYAGQPVGNYQNIDDLLLGNALLNGSSPQSIYSLYQSPGTNQTGYSKSNNDQYNMRMDASLDIGNHAIKLGFQYEQRTNRSIGYAPTGLWTLARDGKGLTNFHLRELDKANPELIKYNDHVDTIIYRRKYDANAQREFDKNLREALGLPVDGLDYIVMDSYDFDAGTIEYYDSDGQIHTTNLDPDDLDIGLFSPDELWNQGTNSAISYRGYDYEGNILSSQPAYEDFFNKKDDEGVFTRDIGAYEPIYMAGYIQDQFAFKDLIFNIGVRVDRFDANQKVLEDPFLLYPAHTVSNIDQVSGFQNVSHPGNMGDDYVVYVDKVNDPTKVVGYRNEYTWFNADGIEILDPSILDVGNGISPALLDQDQDRVTISSFKDYDPQISVMPRISFSFPISDEALFFAHYDVLTQRPNGNIFSDPSEYYFFMNRSDYLNNPSLEPTKTIDYELGYTQKVSNTSSVTFTTFYREMRNMIQAYRFNGAYPKDYTSYSNLDFGTVKGITAEYDLRRTENVRVRASYTLQFADATGSSTTTAAALIAAGLPNLRSTFPMPWDRRHAFNIVIDYRWGRGKNYNGPRINRNKSGKAPLEPLSDFGFSLTINGGSGTPYSASRNVQSPLSPQANLLKGTYGGSRKPWQFRLDLRVDKDFYFKSKKGAGGISSAYLNVYLQVLNVLDTRNIINVYSYTGNANDDGYLTAPEWQREINNQIDPTSFRQMYGNYVENPNYFSTPRQIRLGLIFNF